MVEITGLGTATQESIDSVWAYMAVQPDGREGIIGANIGPGGSFLPLITGDERYLPHFRSVAQEILDHNPDYQVRLVRYTTREVVETLGAS